MKVTKNRFYVLIMNEADKIVNRSNNVAEMKFKLSALPAKVMKEIDKMEKED